MAWEVRGTNGRRYLYRSVREGGRVRKKYVGTGEIASLVAHAEAEIQAEAQALERETRAQVAQAAIGEAEMEELDALASLSVRAAFLAAGYHRHKRGEWRLRRASTQPGSGTRGSATSSTRSSTRWSAGRRPGRS